MTCQEAIDVMGDAVEQRLAPEVQPGFDEHMDECRPCATYFQHLVLTRGVLRGLPGERPSHAQRDELLRRFRRRAGESSRE